MWAGIQQSSIENQNIAVEGQQNYSSNFNLNVFNFSKSKRSQRKPSSNDSCDIL